MKLDVRRLQFLLEFRDATEWFLKKTGGDEDDTIEDWIRFDAIIGDWKNPDAVLLLIKGEPWLIPSSELSEIPREDICPQGLDLDDSSIFVVFKYIGKDEKLLHAVLDDAMNLIHEKGCAFSKPKK